MPSAFLTPLKVQAPEPGEKEWTLLEDFMFYLDDGDDTSETILIRAGFTTDFASVPRWLWWLYPPYSPQYGKAAVLHDGVYCAHTYSQIQCDGLFLDGMRVLGANRITRNTMHAAVRVFGAPVYNAHTPESVNMYRTMVIRMPAGRALQYKAGVYNVGQLIDMQKQELAP